MTIIADTFTALGVVVAVCSGMVLLAMIAVDLLPRKR